MIFEVPPLYIDTFHLFILQRSQYLMFIEVCLTIVGE